MSSKATAGLVLGLTLASSTAVAQVTPGGPRLSEPEVGAQTEPPSPPSKVRLQFEATSEFPVFLGGALTLELPGRVHVGAGIGAVPDAYLDAAGGVATSIAGLEGAEVDLVRAALDGEWAARVYVGWQPFEEAGLYLRFGYQALQLGADLDGPATLTAVTGIAAPAGVGNVTASSTLHMLFGEVGYRWRPDPVTVRLSLGFTGTVSSPVAIAIDAPANQALANQLAREGELVLQNSLQSYVFTPTVGLAIGYDVGL